jgi:glycosyltransferase involved in cell wall biosynthesis
LEGLSRFAEGTVVVLGEKGERVQMGGFQVEALPALGKGRMTRFMELRMATQRAAAEMDRLDAVVTYDPLRSGLLGSWVAKARGIPLIVEVNGDYSHPANYSDLDSPLARWLKRKSFMGLERFVLRRASGVRLLFPEMLDSFGAAVRGTEVRVIPDIPNLDHFRDRGETPEILFVGHPFYLKGVDLLIEAFKRVSERFPDWRLKILGWFPDPRAAEQAIAGHPRIELHPPVEHREVARHMGRCGIFVLPSRTEAMGRVLIEAMACRKPRIGSRVGGIPTVIRDEVDGLLFESEDVEGLARQLARLMEDPDLRSRLGTAALERQKEEFSLARYLTDTRDFYRTTVRRYQRAHQGAGAGR